MRKPAFCICENKGADKKQISAFVFATRIVQFLYFLNPKIPASSHSVCFYSLVCIRAGRKPRRRLSHAGAHIREEKNGMSAKLEIGRKQFVSIYSLFLTLTITEM